VRPAAEGAATDARRYPREAATSTTASAAATLWSRERRRSLQLDLAFEPPYVCLLQQLLQCQQQHAMRPIRLRLLWVLRCRNVQFQGHRVARHNPARRIASQRARGPRLQAVVQVAKVDLELQFSSSAVSVLPHEHGVVGEHPLVFAHFAPW
jgi:hypothetical protein